MTVWDGVAQVVGHATTSPQQEIVPQVCKMGEGEGEEEKERRVRRGEEEEGEGRRLSSFLQSQ